MLKGKPFMTTGALFMGLIVVLGAIGIVNGLWSKNLVLEGQVQTGDLNADWDCAWTNDDGVTTDCTAFVSTEAVGDAGLDPDNYDWPDFNNTQHVLKNVGRCTVTIDSAATPPYGPQVAHVLIENAYPSYECTITLLLSNTGTIPFNFAGAVIHSIDGNIELRNEDASTDGSGECTFPVEGTQIDPGDEGTVTCTVHVRQTAAQSSLCNNTGWLTNPLGFSLAKDFDCESTQTYSFVIEACVAQWNEAANFTQCKNSSEHEGPDFLNDLDLDGIPNATDACPSEQEDGVVDLDDIATDGCASSPDS